MRLQWVFILLWLNGFGIVESELIKRLGWIDWSAAAAAEIVRSISGFGMAGIYILYTKHLKLCQKMIKCGSIS